MSHPIIDDLLWRHTVKKYDPSRKISAENFAIILEALRLSASSINSQPWRFIVIESDTAKERMHKTFANKHHNNQQHVYESSHIILFAYNPHYSREDYSKVIDKYIRDNRITPENRDKAFTSFSFAEQNTNSSGNNGCWTKAQTYIALGNVLHTLARLRIGSTPIEGIDRELVNQEFADELGDYQCDTALAIGYAHPTEDYNAKLPKSRLNMKDILIKI